MKRKVLIVINSLYGGGAEKILQTLLQNLDSNKFELSICSVNRSEIGESYPKDSNFYYIFDQPNFYQGKLRRLWVKLKNKIKLIIYYHCSPHIFYSLFVKGKYDTEVAFIEGYATRIISGSTNRDSTKIAWVHIDLVNNHWTKIAYRNPDEEKVSYTHFNHVVSVSNTVKSAIDTICPNIKHSIVLYNPINSDEIILKSKE